MCPVVSSVHHTLHYPLPFPLTTITMLPLPQAPLPPQSYKDGGASKELRFGAEKLGFMSINATEKILRVRILDEKAESLYETEIRYPQHQYL